MEKTDRNKAIGTAIGKTAGRAVQMFTFYKVAQFTSPQIAIATKVGVKYGAKLVRYTTKTYRRTNFDSNLIFSDAIDSSFNAH